MISYIYYIAISATLNATRGMDIISRFSFLVLHFSTSFLIFNDWILSSIITVGIYSWLSKGWGVYFTSFDPDPELFRDRYNRSVKFIHKICDKVFSIDKDFIPSNNVIRNWGTLGMALRGFIFSIPLFIGLAIYLNNPFIGLLSMPMLLQGYIYRYIGNKKRIFGLKLGYGFRTAEKLTASLLSILIIISLCI